MKKTGGEIIWECLKREGVKHVFGYPGGAILPAYDALCKYPEIHHVLVRHNTGALASPRVPPPFSTAKLWS